MPQSRLRRLLFAVSVPAAVAVANPLQAQELWGRGVPTGQLQFTIGGLFESADERLGGEDGRAPLAGDWLVSDATLLFPNSPTLLEALRSASGLPGWTPVAGPVRGEAQVSRVTFPVELRVGVLDRLTVGARVTSRIDRVEADFRVPPTAEANLGLSPTLTDLSAVEPFLGSLASSIDALDDPAWTAFGTALTEAYQSRTLFPLAGSELAQALTTRLAEFNTALAEAGLPPVSGELVFPGAPLTADGIAEILENGQGLFRYQPVGTRLLSWNPGDAEVWASWELIRRGGLNELRGSGVSLYGGARLPTGTLENPNLHFDAGSGDGQLDILAGADGWLRRERWGISGGIDLAVATSVERGVRVFEDGDPFAPAINFQLVNWTPGTEFRLRLYPSLSPAPGLWLDAGYALARQADGTFELDLDLEGIPSSEAISARSGYTRHDLTFGLRYRPPDLADGRMEVWSRWTGAIGGEGPDTPAWSVLEPGGRVWRTIW